MLNFKVCWFVLWNSAIYFSFFYLSRQEVCGEGSSVWHAADHCWAAEAVSRRPTQPHHPPQRGEDSS